MKLNALELHNLVDEFDVLKDSKVSRIFQPKRKELLFQLHSRQGNKMLRINVPEYIYLTDFKEDQPSNPSGFCMLLRKYLVNSVIKKIEQKGFERVVEMVFDTKQGLLILVVELFSKGNVVLCKQDYEIIMPLEKQLWKDRKIMKGEIYKFPVRKYDFLKLSKKELKELVEDSDKENIVKMLAIDLGLGGEYAEELCLMAKIDKKKKKLDAREVNALFKAVVVLREKKIKDVNKKFNEHFSKEIRKEIVSKKTGESDEKVNEMKRIIKTQEEQIGNFEKEIEENKRKAEFIYENYTRINSLLEKIRKLKEKHSWKEVKEKVKEIKEVNEKEGKVVVELKKIIL